MKTVIKSTRFFKSLRFRILVILVILGIIPCAIIGRGIISSYEDRALSLRSSNVKNQCDILCNLMIKENYFSDSSSAITNAKLEMLSNIYNGRILVIDRDFRIIKDTYNTDEGKIMVSSDVIQCFRKESPSHYYPKTHLLEMALPIQSPDVQSIQGVMLVSFSTSEIDATISILDRSFFLIFGIIGAVVLALGYWLSAVLVKPLARITKSIEDLTDGYRTKLVAVNDYTETELITEAFNNMLTRMRAVDQSREEFVSNVSHELKTPLTSMKVLADSLVGQEGVPEELYQEFMRDITEEIDRESKIITDLLSLVKMDKTASNLLNVQRLNINKLAESVLKRLRPIADQKRVDLILDSYREVEADVDEVKFTLAITNLIENSIKYNVKDGWVRVTIDADHQYFYITVADSGIGIPEESLERIFERFYRVDKSHSREIGGTGLGLAITRSAISRHNGTIKVESKEGEGTEFKIRIPLTYIS